ncbi:MAG: STAS/SEC14 domain-containing protein [Blastocatellia bacterium]
MASNLSSEQILSALEELSSAELERLVPRVVALGAARRAPHLNLDESKLLARIEERIPDDLKNRLSLLEAKRDDGSLTGAEAVELLRLSDRAETLHAERLTALAELAKLRGKTLPALMDQLGIKFPDNA